MTKFFYVYMLKDVATGTHVYTGVTADLHSRLAKHNAGEVPHTSKFKPWRIETAIAFSSKEKAYAFEAYLKTHSGRSFAKRHFRHIIPPPNLSSNPFSGGPDPLRF